MMDNRLAIALGLLVLACQPRAAEQPPLPTEPPEAPHEDEPAHEGMPTRVRLTAEAEKGARLKLEEVQWVRLAPTMEIGGEVMPDPDLEAHVPARVPARVVAVHFKEGDTVQKGQALVTLESIELAKARAAWTAANARAKAAQDVAQRLAAIAVDGLVTQQQAVAAAAEAGALQAEATAARQVLSGYGADISSDKPDEAALLVLRAPIRAVAVNRNAVLGKVVPAGETLATLVNLDRVWFQARLFERNLAQVQPGARADVRLNAFPNQSFEGVVEAVGYQVDPTARTVVARIGLKNHKDLLRVGLFGTARVVVDGPAAGAEVLTIPASAVTQLDGRPAAFVAQPDGHYEVHFLVLGAAAAGRLEVVRGVAAGERVVTDGLLTLKSVLLKSTFGEED